MKKKRKVVLLAILMVSALALYGGKNFFVNKIYNHIFLQKEIQYLESAENTQEEILEQVVADEDATVYITTYGEKYHREYCRYLRYTKKEIALEKAKRLEYTPCTVCNP